jgi:hypothetical protein
MRIVVFEARDAEAAYKKIVKYARDEKLLTLEPH